MLSCVLSTCAGPLSDEPCFCSESAYRSSYTEVHIQPQMFANILCPKCSLGFSFCLPICRSVLLPLLLHLILAPFYHKRLNANPAFPYLTVLETKIHPVVIYTYINSKSYFKIGLNISKSNKTNHVSP